MSTSSFSKPEPVDLTIVEGYSEIEADIQATEQQRDVRCCCTRRSTKQLLLLGCTLRKQVQAHMSRIPAGYKNSGNAREDVHSQ